MNIPNNKNKGTILIIASILIFILSVLTINYSIGNITIKKYNQTIILKYKSNTLAIAGIEDAIYGINEKSYIDIDAIDNNGDPRNYVIVWTDKEAVSSPMYYESEDELANIIKNIENNENYLINYYFSESDIFKGVKGYYTTYLIRDKSENVLRLVCIGKIINERDKSVILKKKVETLLQRERKHHPIYDKVIYAGCKEGIPQTFEITGKGSQRDVIDGDIHIQGDVMCSLDGYKNLKVEETDEGEYRSNITASGRIYRVNEVGEEIDFPSENLPPDCDPSVLENDIEPPIIDANQYLNPKNRARSWDDTRGKKNGVVFVNEEMLHYANENNPNPISDLSILDDDPYENVGNLTSIKIAREGGYFYEGGYNEWNDKALIPPDNSLANFFMLGYQNHFCKDYSPYNDTQITNTTNFYLGQRNGGEKDKFGNKYGLYGGGHAVIKITKDQNNKVYFINGNLWIDSDGCNHVFFVPGDDQVKEEGVKLTIVVKGNIYIGDQIYSCGREKSLNKNIGGNSHAECFKMLNPNEVLEYTNVRGKELLNPKSAVAFIAIPDGESYNDINKNGKYDIGEAIIGRDDPYTPNQAENNPMFTEDYCGRMEGSGNIIFGDTIKGPVGSVEAFLFADNNFSDITADTSQGDQRPYVFGNMTAGNYVYLNRNYEDWKFLVTRSSIPNTWNELLNNKWYPPQTLYGTPITLDEIDNPFLVTRRAIEENINEKYKIKKKNATEMQGKIRGGWGCIGKGYYLTKVKEWDEESQQWVYKDEWIPFKGWKTFDKPTKIYGKIIKKISQFNIYYRRHSPLLADFDDRILRGDLALPRLPQERDAKGYWKPLVWIGK